MLRFEPTYTVAVAGLPVADLPLAHCKAVEGMAEELSEVLTHVEPLHSAHEGWAVIAEELDELWEHVRRRQGSRDREAMRREAIQVAVTAIRFAAEVGGEE